jgi:hypothetical protein
MNQERWDEIKEKIENKFKISAKNVEVLENKGIKEIIEFEGPLGKIKLEFVNQPKILDKKTQYSNRIGGQTNVKYVYSDSETSSYLKIYKQDKETEEWVEINQSIFSF